MSFIDYILFPFAWLLLFFFHITGSYGMALILFCLAVKILLFPISLKGRKGMIGMSAITEEQKRLQQKCGRDRQRYSQELTELYAREGVKPSSGCLWSLLPMPLLIALYAVVRQPLTYLMKLSGDEVNTLANFLGFSGSGGNVQLEMAQVLFERFGDVTAKFPELADKLIRMDFRFLGINLSDTPDLFFFQKADNFNWGSIGLFLIPFVSALLSFVSMKVSSRITNRVLGKEGKGDSGPKSMNFLMPLMSLWICFTLPAGLGVYWIANSVFAILQEFVSIGFLRGFVKKAAEEKRLRDLRRVEMEKEQKKAMALQRQKAQEEARRIRQERQANKQVSSEGRVGIRAYAKGRTYDPERYPVTPYADPDVLARERRAAAALAEKEAEQSGKKKKPRRGKQAAPAAGTVSETAVETVAETAAETAETAAETAAVAAEAAEVAAEAAETVAETADAAAETAAEAAEDEPPTDA